MILYSKRNITDSIEAMNRKNRLAHAFLLVGEKGSGKKTAADYIAGMLLCDTKNACGECRNCRRIERKTHPDVIRPERTGKKLIYSRDTIRMICSDAFTFPNDCDSKVYIFADCENIEENTQNLLLKLIEEPPGHAYFIFTAVNREVFLPTFLSRVITLGVGECSEDECRKALLDTGRYDESSVEAAVSHFHGNIGLCAEFLDNDSLVRQTEACKMIIDGIAESDEYKIIKTLAQLGENRAYIRDVLTLADKVVRDSCVIRINPKESGSLLTGCYREGAEKLSGRLSFKRASVIHEAFYQYSCFLAGNVNCSAAVSALGGILVG